jgi:hypothetical protein
LNIQWIASDFAVAFGLSKGKSESVSAAYFFEHLKPLLK